MDLEDAQIILNLCVKTGVWCVLLVKEEPHRACSSEMNSVGRVDLFDG